MAIQLIIGPEAITSYRRLAYSPWHAIAEFVDNSTQSYFDNRAVLDEQMQKDEDRLLTVSIVYDKNNDLLRVADNAMGMSVLELEQALHVARPPANTSGRSKYGMGMKTAACWIGNKWTVTTKKLGGRSGAFGDGGREQSSQKRARRGGPQEQEETHRQALHNRRDCRDEPDVPRADAGEDW